MDFLVLEVFRYSLASVAEEMGVTLQRSAHSPNITERRDFSCALATRDGEMCAQAEHIPVHLGSMPSSIQAVLDRLGPLSEGDVALVNDPFAGGTHLPDLTAVSPAFSNGKLIGYLANRAHHADVGGRTPGSMPGDSANLQEEGVSIAPSLAFKSGQPVSEVIDRFIESSRSPGERRGDLRAQFGANATGIRRLCELSERFGVDGLQTSMRELIDYSERSVRQGISQLPDGEWSFTDDMDSDGAGGGPFTIAASIRIDGDSVAVDFAGTSQQVPGNINTVLPVTVSCVAYVIRALTGSDVPPTSGGMRPVEVLAPKGCLVNAQPPAAVSAGNVETSQRIVDVLLGALAGAIPEQIPAASQGTMNNLLIGGADFAYYETIAGGQGANSGKAGHSGVQTHMTNTRNTPAESIEYSYPLRVLRYELRDSTGGEGRYPGGMGIRRDVEILSESATVSLQTERRRSSPWGLSGGGPGSPGSNLLLRPLPDPTPNRGTRLTDSSSFDDYERIELPDKCSIEVHRGDVISIRTPGGGGWGAAAP